MQKYMARSNSVGSLNPGRFVFKFVVLGMYCCFFFQSFWAFAQDAVPEKIDLNGKEWRLYSEGVRTYAFIDVYQCALYLEQSGNFSVSPQALKQPIAMTITIMTSELPDAVPDPWKETIKPEVSDKVYKRFKKKFAQLKEGDRLAFSFLPGKSTDFFLNGKKVFSDKGSELIEALLDQWMGEEPISEDLKVALMKPKS